MSSNTKKPETPPAKDTKDTEKTKDTTTDTSKPAEESGFMKFYHKYFKTDYLVWIFFGILFFYYFLNNYRFVNGKYYNTHGSRLIGSLGAFFLFFFYIFFFLIIISAYRDMMEHDAKDPKDKKSGGLGLTIVGTVITIAVMILTLYYLPYSFANAGIIAKGLLRVWNPFSTRASRDFPNATDIRLPQNRENPIEGYDTDGLYWGDSSYWGKFKFYVLSLPLIVSNFFAGSFPFNYYLIPAISGDGSQTGTDWTRPITGSNPDGSKKYGQAENVFVQKGGGLGWILWFISFMITLPYRALNAISYYINKWITGEERNLIYEYFNPVDWEAMGTLLMPDPNYNNTTKRESISRLFNTVHFETKYSFTRTYAVWFNVYFLVMAYQLVSNQFLFPYSGNGSSKSPMNNIKNTIALILIVVTAFYIVWQVIQQSQKEVKYLNLLNFRSLGPQKISLDALKDSVTRTAIKTMPGLFSLVENSDNVNSNEPSGEPNASEPDAGEPNAGEPNVNDPNAELPSVGNLDKAMENKTRAHMGVTSATVTHNSALKNKENAEAAVQQASDAVRSASPNDANYGLKVARHTKAKLDLSNKTEAHEKAQENLAGAKDRLASANKHLNKLQKRRKPINSNANVAKALKAHKKAKSDEFDLGMHHVSTAELKRKAVASEADASQKLSNAIMNTDAPHGEANRLSNLHEKAKAHLDEVTALHNNATARLQKAKQKTKNAASILTKARNAATQKLPEHLRPVAHAENRELLAARKEHANATALKNRVETKARNTQQKLAQHQQMLNAKMQQGTNTLNNHRKAATLQAEAVQHPRILHSVRQKHAAATDKLAKAQQKAHQAKRTREGKLYPSLSYPSLSSSHLTPSHSARHSAHSARHPARHPAHSAHHGTHL